MPNRFRRLNASFGKAAAALAVLCAVAWFMAFQITRPVLGESAEPPAAQVWIPIQPTVETVWLTGHEEGPFVTAEAAVLFENTTGTVLYAKNPHKKRAPASTTKILTAILALERGHLDDIVTVSRKAAGTTGSTARLYTGQKIRLEDLLHGLLLRSGNDAAVAIAEHIGGEERIFVDWMNRRAADLGAEQSHFRNPHGLDATGHVSTAYDLALLSRVALHYPLFGEIVRKQSYDYQGTTWQNTNKLLWRFEGIEGIKTGTTSRAGYCLVAAASQNGMQLISVVLGSRDRWNDSSRLLEYGFENFHLLTLADRGDVLAHFPIEDGLAPAVAVVRAPLQVVIKAEDRDRVSTQLAIDPGLKAPVRRGDLLGHYNIYIGEELVHQVALTADATVHKRTPLRLFIDWFEKRF